MEGMEELSAIADELTRTMRRAFVSESDDVNRPSNDTPHPSESDDVNNPSHYTSHPSGIECIEITEHMDFTLGNAVKYIWRAGLKSNDPIKDLEKAVWYLNRKIDFLKKYGPDY